MKMMRDSNAPKWANLWMTWIACCSEVEEMIRRKVMAGTVYLLGKHFFALPMKSLVNRAEFLHVFMIVGRNLEELLQKAKEKASLT
jgi:hypothetical protein